MTSDEVKTRRLLEETAKIMEASGVAFDIEAISNIEQAKVESKKTKQEFRNAIEVLLQREHYVHATTVKICKGCGEKFITTYCYHWFCSDLCAITEFKKHYGFDPRNLTLPRNEWPIEPTGAVPAKMTKWLFEWAKNLVKKVEELDQTDFENLESDYPEEGETEKSIVFEDSVIVDLSSIEIDLGEPLDEDSVIQQESSQEQDLLVPANPQPKQSMPDQLEDIFFDL